jgi:hypothetical protein
MKKKSLQSFTKNESPIYTKWKSEKGGEGERRYNVIEYF